MKALCRRVILWRGSLLPLGCAAVVNPANAVLLINRVRRFWGRFATQREQAPSPQKPAHTVGDLQDITGQVFVLCQFAEVAVDVLGVDQDHLVVVGAGQITGAERYLFQQTLKQRVQAAGTDVLGLLVDLPGDLGDALDPVRLELDGQAFGFQQGAVLLGQRRVRLAENALEVFRGQRFQLDANRQATLQLRHQIARLAQVERTGSDEQDVVGLDHAQFGVDGAAFDQWQQVTLHAFARHVDAAGIAALGDLVDFVDEHDTVLLYRFQRLGLQLFIVDQATGFFVTHQFQRFLDLELAAFLFALAHVGEQALQLVVISSMPGGAEISTPATSATSISISLSSSWPSRRRLRNSWRVLELAEGAASSLWKPMRAGGSRASRMRSSAASSARWRTLVISCSRSSLMAASARSRMIDSTSRPT